MAITTYTQTNPTVFGTGAVSVVGEKAKESWAAVKFCWLRTLAYCLRMFRQRFKNSWKTRN